VVSRWCQKPPVRSPGAFPCWRLSSLDISTGGRARTDTVLSHHRILSLALLVHSVLMCPRIWLTYADFGRFARLRCPARTGLYWPGCSTVAVRMQPPRRDSRWLRGPGEGSPEPRTVWPRDLASGLIGIVVFDDATHGLPISATGPHAARPLPPGSSSISTRPPPTTRMRRSLPESSAMPTGGSPEAA
jgi:hypothetical protein